MGFTSVGIGSTANYGFLQFYGTSNTLCWTANGTVGIGMTNPLYSLDVLGTTQLRCVIPSFGQPDSTVLPSISYTSLAQQWNVVSGLSTSVNWTGCGLSSTGQYQTAIVSGANSGNNIYYSSNYGATWSLATGFLANANYYKGAVSGSGQYQLVGISNTSSALYVSSNYGQTWSATSYTIGASAYGRSSCLSNNGQYQFNVQAGSGTGRIAVSSNYGATFANSSAPAGDWHGVCCSSTGQYVSACSAGGYIWNSTNYGSTWTQSSSILASWVAMCCSTSGQYQMAVINGTGAIYYSSDYGVNWTLSNAPAISWGFISCTSTGQYMIATSGSYMYYSTNYGVTWSQSTSIFASWQACAISQNGVYALACVSSGAVYSSLLSNVALAANGTVGIGITNPQYSLDVLGAAQLRGSFGQPDVNPLPSNAYTSMAQQWNVVSGVSSSVNWYGCAVSATGQYQTALINGANSGNNIYYSSNYGATWSLATGFLANAAYIWMGMSGTGQYQLTSINAGSTALYVSSNYGQTWSATSYTIGASASGRSSCISYNGQYQFNVQGGGSIAVSSNYGATFANAAVSTGGWNGVCCSSSGQYVTACIYGGNISYSTNYGVAWTACTGLSNANWSQMCCSASGQYQMVTVGSGSIWYSSNYGVNWTVSNAPTSAGWQSIACTSSGQYVIAPISSGKFYYSTNYGVTWTILSSSPSVAWQACAISQNGVYALACANGSGAVYSSVLSGIAMIANGMVGIGMTAPAYPLDVSGITRSAGVINTSPAHYIGYTTTNPTIFQSNGTNNTSGTIYSGVYNYVAFPTNLQTPAGFITPVGGKYTVAFSGIYSITFTTGTAGTNNGQLETFIAKNQYNNSTDLNQPGTGTLASSYHPASTTQWSFSWTGYLSTTDFFTVGFYTGATAGSLSVRTTLSVALVNRTA